MSTGLDNRPARRRLAWLLAVILLLGLGAAWHGGAKGRMIRELESTGGRCRAVRNAFSLNVQHPILSVRSWQQSEEREACLVGRKFDDRWLAEHDDLALLSPTCITLYDTGLSRQAARRLLQRDNLLKFEAFDIPFTDEDVSLFNGSPRLANLRLQNCPVTDAGLAAIHVPDLCILFVGGTEVSAAGLQSYLRDRRVVHLGVDGRQFTPELATFLQSKSELDCMDLIGRDVMDAHLALLESIPTIRAVHIDHTSVSPEAIAKLRSSHPAWAIYVDYQRFPQAGSNEQQHASN